MTTTSSSMTGQSLQPNHTTRVLCSAVLIESGFASLVYRTLCIPHVQAVAPSPGVDLVLLARHAAYAVKQQQRRQAILSAALFSMVIPIVGIFSIPGATGFWFILTLLIAGGTKVWSISQDVAMAQMATRLFDLGTVEDLGSGLIDVAHEQRLAVVNDANLSIYSWERSDDPFPGLGQRIDAHVRMPVDIARPKDPSQPVQPVVANQLLDHLARTIPRYIDVTSINDARRVRMVLYVLGSTVKQFPNLLPDPNGAPIGRVPPQMLRDTADRPSGEARTYLRAQIIGHSGHVITTVHLTAVTSPAGLSLDLALHVLRPIHTAFFAADRLPRSTPRLTWRMLRRDGIWPGLLRAPGRGLEVNGLLHDGRQPATLTHEQRKAIGTQDFYGARLGIREVTSYNSSFRFNEKNDADRQFNDIMVAIMRELINLLESRNIDTSDFRQQQTNIINNVTHAINTTVNGAYVSGGPGGVSVSGNLQINAKNLPNLGATGP